MKNKFYNRTALVIFIIILFSSFISFPGLANRANAAYALYSYIRDFSVSATQMSYYQERDGYVCIRAFPYYPEYIDPEYPGDPPFPYTDYEHPTVIYRSQMELVGQKNLSWQERDEVGNAIEPGLYMFETMIYPLPNCGGWPISDYGEQAEFEIQAPEPPQSWSFAIISDLHVGEPGLDYGGPTWDDANSVGNDTIYSVKNLKKVIEQINSNKDKYNIKFVVVTGDFSDSGELSELIKAKEILNTLDPDITWIPLIGNHDVWPIMVLIQVLSIARPIWLLSH